MKSPIIKQEQRQLLKNFTAEWEKKYAAILATGAVAEVEFSSPHDNRLAKWALILAAEQFGPLYPSDKKEL